MVRLYCYVYEGDLSSGFLLAAHHVKLESYFYRSVNYALLLILKTLKVKRVTSLLVFFYLVHKLKPVGT